MDHKQEFFNNHDIIAIMGCFRFGSTALGSLFKHWYDKNRALHQRPPLFLNEFLVNHHYITKHGNALHMGYLSEDRLAFGDRTQDHTPWLELTAVRPPPPHVMEAKLRWLKQTQRTHMISMKLDPMDWEAHGAALLDQYLLSDPRTFRIGLCRQDVGNAMISYAVGVHFNFWNYNQEEYQREISRPIEPITLKIHTVQIFCNAVLSHLNYLLYAANTLDSMVWYNQLTDLIIPKIGLIHESESWLYKNPMEHHTRAHKYFTNAQDVINLATDFQAQMDPVLEEVRKATDHLAYYRG
jgi:hypothetical protein